MLPSWALPVAVLVVLKCRPAMRTDACGTVPLGRDGLGDHDAAKNAARRDRSILRKRARKEQPS
eukprot:6442170-Alexandrium_andersonii.AAC.1